MGDDHLIEGVPGHYESFSALWMWGGHGNDYIRGGHGADTLFGNQGADVLDSQNGNDKLHAGSGYDILRGDFGADELYGHRGNDRLDGGFGADMLNGGAGADLLTGDPDAGAGADRFVFTATIVEGGLTGNDTITDFDRSEGDVIRVWGQVAEDVTIIQVGADSLITHALGTVLVLGVTGLTVDMLEFM
ncbi:calcium-binding protein [Mesobacterium pallidum]|uniref:calcium-binding protein n=1 Tax=Mesobacterium pallidum TaxID=2872037 RepID=UPI001EE187D4|nr:calcium-binding protein [Mesobacterium pallidum]